LRLEDADELFVRAKRSFFVLEVLEEKKLKQRAIARGYAMNPQDEKIEFEESSGNIFADLGLEDADELFVRAKIGFFVFKILEEKKLKQREIATVLGIAQSDVSHLMNGHFNRFTTDKLLDFLKRLDQKVTIQISHHQQDEPYQQVIFAS